MFSPVAVVAVAYLNFSARQPAVSSGSQDTPAGFGASISVGRTVTPEMGIVPIAGEAYSPENQMLPSGPTANPARTSSDGEYVVTVPDVVIMPTLPFELQVSNHRFPSGAETMLLPTSTPLGSEYSVIVPEVVILPIFLVLVSVNHSLPSGPAVIPAGLLSVGREYSPVTTPAVVILTILFLNSSVNQTFPSGPAAMSVGRYSFGSLYVVIVPLGVIFAILFGVEAYLSAPNQTLPSGPGARTPPLKPSGRE